MDLSKKYRKKSFLTISLISLLVAAGFSAGLFYGIEWGLATFSTEAGKELWNSSLPKGLALMELGRANFYIWVVPSLAGGLLVLGWIFWGLLYMSVASIFKTREIEAEKTPRKKPGKKDFLDQKIERDRKQRLFLHTLSVLQREGRLLDFFDEDLGNYQDEQIGAAVRSIQEDCKKAVKKYIDLKPVIDQEEGETIKVDPGFDMDAINLVGNVAGEPPFTGVLKHRGWKAGKKEVPKLSDIQDAGVISPAEVEIQ